MKDCRLIHTEYFQRYWWPCMKIFTEWSNFDRDIQLYKNDLFEIVRLVYLKWRWLGRGEGGYTNHP